MVSGHVWPPKRVARFWLVAALVAAPDSPPPDALSGINDGLRPTRAIPQIQPNSSQRGFPDHTGERQPIGQGLHVGQLAKSPAEHPVSTWRHYQQAHWPSPYSQPCASTHEGMFPTTPTRTTPKCRLGASRPPLHRRQGLPLGRTTFSRAAQKS